nr:streptophobe family protein [Streptomyces halobius]
MPATLGFGLLWLLALLALTFLVSRRAPLSSRLLHFQNSVRPPAFAMLLVLLCYAVIGLIVGVIVLITEGHPAETLAVLLLGLPNLAWIALGVGTGGAWTGHVDKAPAAGTPPAGGGGRGPGPGHRLSRQCAGAAGTTPGRSPGRGGGRSGYQRRRGGLRGGWPDGRLTGAGPTGHTLA